MKQAICIKMKYIQKEILQINMKNASRFEEPCIYFLGFIIHEWVTLAVAEAQLTAVHVRQCLSPSCWKELVAFKSLSVSIG